MFWSVLQQVFRERGIGMPFGLQLHGRTLGIIGMGAIGNFLQYLNNSVPHLLQYVSFCKGTQGRQHFCF